MDPQDHLNYENVEKTGPPRARLSRMYIVDDALGGPRKEANEHYHTANYEVEVGTAIYTCQHT